MYMNKSRGSGSIQWSWFYTRGFYTRGSWRENWLNFSYIAAPEEKNQQGYLNKQLGPSPTQSTNPSELPVYTLWAGLGCMRGACLPHSLPPPAVLLLSWSAAKSNREDESRVLSVVLETVEVGGSPHHVGEGHIPLSPQAETFTTLPIQQWHLLTFCLS